MSLCNMYTKILIYKRSAKELERSIEPPARMNVSPVRAFLVLLCVYEVRCTNPVRAEIDQLKLLYQQMDAKLREVAAENQRLKATVTRASHHASEYLIVHYLKLNMLISLVVSSL